MEKTDDILYFKTSPLLKNNQAILTGIELSLKKGSWTALMGKSGVGKTLLLKSISQLKNNISYIGQNDRLIPWLTLSKNISLASLLCKKNTSKNSVQSLLKMIKLQGYENAFPHKISYGMQTRVLLARALYQGGEVFLLDEIFNGLDDETKENVYTSIQSILKDKTIFLVTHNKTDALRMTSSIYELEGRPATLKRLNLKGDTA